MPYLIKLNVVARVKNVAAAAAFGDLMNNN